MWYSRILISVETVQGYMAIPVVMFNGDDSLCRDDTETLLLDVVCAPHFATGVI